MSAWDGLYDIEALCCVETKGQCSLGAAPFPPPIE